MEAKGFFKFEILMSAVSDLFEYLCFGSTAILNRSILTVRESTLKARF